MELNGFFSRRKHEMLDRWYRQVADTYSKDASLFLRSEPDRFANPVGHSIKHGLRGLLEGLLAGADRDRLAPSLDDIVRIRAVQDFSPSEAVSFVFSLKDIVREMAAGDDKGGDTEELTVLEGRIDRLALQAFDNYMVCRETLFDIKVKELRERVSIQAGLRPGRAAGSRGPRR